ncbi:unnamed protein product [Colletotrichum noveboracense]|uniref:NmrA-like domain-containing protein n=1 Tax=Colletotrichum noveboracense TaxID=2664923 RepID=A0A9W4WRB0_9PEZI|nr:unnamed protein product [Colletotrichum noveboracense]
MKVAIVGGSGETGTSIINALFEFDIIDLEIIALTRPASVKNPNVVALEKRGVTIASVDLEAPQAELVNVLKDVDALISTIHVSGLGKPDPPRQCRQGRWREAICPLLLRHRRASQERVNTAQAGKEFLAERKSRSLR